MRESGEARRRLAALREELAQKAQVLRQLTGHLEAMERAPEEADDSLRRGEVE